MGSCCQVFFQKQQIHTNQSRLKLLQSKITVFYRTINDNNFTYYLHLFDQHRYLQKVLQQFKQFTEKTEDASNFQIPQNRIVDELSELNTYIKKFTDESSQLRKKIAEDEAKIKQQLKLYKGVPFNSDEGCMIKLQIQNIEVIKGITRIAVIKQIKTNDKNSNSQYLIINRIKSQKIYREMIFPSYKGSKIKIITDPFIASITIDLEDIVKNQVSCDIFTFKNQEQEYGFIAIRLQYVSVSSLYKEQKIERLKILEKQLKLCAQGKEGLDKLSSYQSQSSSIRQTFLSDRVSQYNNQYHI